MAVQTKSVIGYLQEVLGYPALKIGYLNVFPLILYRLHGIGEVCIPAYQYCHVIKVVPGKIQQVSG
ncbi:hypothetical protein ES703_65675 [subsurface metagenome]